MNTQSTSTTITQEVPLSLDEEFDAQTPSEVALVKIAKNSLSRMSKMSELFLKHLEQAQKVPTYSYARELPTISKPEERTLKFFSKEMDRAHKRFISSLTALKQAKSGPLQVNINTAFVAQNQQNVANTP